MELEFKSRHVRGKLCFIISLTAFEPHKILVLGHSFVRRLREDLEVAFDERASWEFHLQGTAQVRLYGVGGRTVSKLRQHDLSIVSSSAPDIVTYEIGTNDLAVDRPEVVSSAIRELVRFLRKDMSFRAVGVCKVIPRGKCYPPVANFNESVSVLNQYTLTSQSVTLSSTNAIRLRSITKITPLLNCKRRQSHEIARQLIS